MGLPLQIFHAERCVRRYAPDGPVPRRGLRAHRQRAKKLGLILCMASSIRPIFSRPRLRELLVVIVGAFGRVRRALHPSRLVRGRFLAALVPVVGLLDLVAFGAGGPAGRGGRRRRVDAGLGDRAGRNRRLRLARSRRRWGLSPCSLLSPCWLSSQPPSEPAASWKGSSMRARMTPTPEAPGCWRQVVCSCEGPPVRVPMPLKATRPRSSAM